MSYEKSTHVSLPEIRRYIFNNQVVPEEKVVYIFFRLLEQLITENNVVFISSPCIVVGDLHGQLSDVFELIKKTEGINSDHIDPDYKLQKKYVFMGDYVDRGYSSLNTFLLIASYKLENKQNIALLRGNHESRQVSRTYGFYYEISAFYGHAGLWVMANEVFDLLPLCALIDSDIFCVHGGLSPNLRLIDRISLLNRQDEVPQEGPISDLLWSDPDSKVTEFRQNGRGAGWVFGETDVKIFNRLNRISMICRSHQLANDGFQTFFGDLSPSNKTTNPNSSSNLHSKSSSKSVGAKKNWRLITIWSAPDYCYRSGNKAAVFRVPERSLRADDTNNLIFFEKAENRLKPDEAHSLRPNSSYFC